MQSFIAVFLAYILAVVFVGAVPVPQPQLGSLPLGDITGNAGGPAAIPEHVVSVIEGLATNGDVSKRQLGEITSLISDPTAIPGTIESLPGDVAGNVSGLGGSGAVGDASGLLKRQLDGVGNLVSDPAAIAGNIVSTVGGLAGNGLGSSIPKRQLGSIDAAAVVPNLLQGLDLGPAGDVVAGVEKTVENAAGGL